MRRLAFLAGCILLASSSALAQSAAPAADPSAIAIPNPLKTTAPAVLPAGSEETSAPPCVPMKQAKDWLGKTGCVSGKVLKVAESQGGNIFVNFCSSYKKCDFSAVALKRDSESLGDLRELEGKVVELRGEITAYKGNAGDRD